LQDPDFGGVKTVRSFAEFLNHFPLRVAIWLGVTDLHLLGLAFSLGCFLPWPMAMLICRRLAPKHLWVVVLACAAGYLNAAFMAVGEHIVAHALFWPAAFALVFVRPLTPFAACALLGSATILLRSYESLVFLGPLLAALALWRGIRRDEKLWQRAVFFLAAILFFTATAIANDSLSKPENGTEYGGFINSMFVVLFRPSWTMGWSAFWICLTLAVCLWTKFSRAAVSRAGIVILTCIILLWGSWPLLAPDHLNPTQQFDARFLDLLVPLALLPVLLALNFRPRWFESRRPFLVGCAAAFLLAQSLWHISATWQWQGYVSIVKSVLASRTGYVAVSDTPLAEGKIPGQSLHFTWYWANPCLSIALSPGGKVKAMLCSAPDGYVARWQPFDPLDPKTFPNLQHYGVDYGDYISAISANRK
jgi:hypothetical protein